MLRIMRRSEMVTEIQFRYRPFVSSRPVRNGDLACRWYIKTRRLLLKSG